MLVTISGTPYYSFLTWTPPLAEQWIDQFAKTWVDLVQPYGNLVVADGPSIRDIVEDRSTADFTILDTAHAFTFEKGQYVSIKDFGYETIFTGYIDTATQQRISPDGVIAHRISCTDNHYLADKRIIAKAFVAATTPTIADCVQWIVSNILTNEGVTVGEITATTAIESISFDYVPCTEALDTLAQYGNCTWFIDYQKKLYFVERTAYPAAWNITEVAGAMTDVLVDSFQVTSSSPEYRNQQYIRGGYAKTALQTEISKGDGETSSFPVGYKIAQVPTVSTSLNGAPYVTKTMGIKGVDTGKDWYWSSNDQIILQDVSGTRLTSVDKIKIEYYGLYQIVTSSADYTEITARQSKEGGGTGIVDSMRDDSLITSETAGLAEANALLDHYASIGTKIEYITTRTGLEAGTLQHIESTIHGIDGDFLITAVEKVPEFHDSTGALNDIIKYHVTAISGPVEDFWTKFFFKLKWGGNTGSLASSTSVVLILKAYSHAWLVGDSPNIWTSAKATTPTTPSTAAVPGFETAEKVTYISLQDSGDTELFRKYYTAQTETASTIITTFILASGEANFTWDHITIYGGSSATATYGTGVKLYEISGSGYTKNSLEAIQVVITDTHW